MASSAAAAGGAPVLVRSPARVHARESCSATRVAAGARREEAVAAAAAGAVGGAAAAAGAAGLAVGLVRGAGCCAARACVREVARAGAGRPR